jgi:hypothetical protein
MSAQQKDAYAAFGNSDAEARCAISTTRSRGWNAVTNSLTGTHDGKQAVGELWGKLMSKDFRTTPHDFVAEGDKVVVLTTRELAGEATEGADVLTFNEDSKLVAFEALGDTAQMDRIFAT